MVTIVGRIVVLQEANTILILLHTLLYIGATKLDVDPLFLGTFQTIDILSLRHTCIDHIIQRYLVRIGYLFTLLEYTTRDDDRIVREDRLNIIPTLEREGRLVVLHEVHQCQTGSLVDIGITHDVTCCTLLQSKLHTINLASTIEGEDYILQLVFAFGEGERHWNAAALNLIAQFHIAATVGTDHTSATILDESVVLLVALWSEAVSQRLIGIRLCLDCVANLQYGGVQSSRINLRDLMLFFLHTVCYDILVHIGRILRICHCGCRSQFYGLLLNEHGVLRQLVVVET